MVVAELGDGRHRGRGECVPYARYGESVESVIAAIEAMRPQLAAGLDRQALQTAMPAGAARNALDCAFWDFEAKRSGRPVHELAGPPPRTPLTTAFTISLGSPAEMAKAAAASAAARCSRSSSAATATMAASARMPPCAPPRPRPSLIVDANEGWNEDNLAANLAACAQAGVVLVEQPLPDGATRRWRPSSGRSRSAPTRACTTVLRCRRWRQI